MPNKSLLDLESQAQNAANLVSSTVNGSTDSLKKEADRLSQIINRVVLQTKSRYGEKTDNDIVSYFNEINFSKAFAEVSIDPEYKKLARKNPNAAFKKYMSENEAGSAEIILQSESDRILTYQNYKAIYTHIPECAQAVDIYRDNIVSADDFTKLGFVLAYNDSDENTKKTVETELAKQVEKYGLEELADTVITDALIMGDEYVACLSINDELEAMLQDPVMANGIINESTMRLLDDDAISIDVSSQDVPTNVNEQSISDIFSGTYKFSKKEIDLRNQTINEEYEKRSKIRDDIQKPEPLTEDNISLNEDEIRIAIAKMVNDNVTIGSKKEFLIENFLAEQENAPVPNMFDLVDTDGNRKKNIRKLKINGNAIKILDPTHVVELKVDNICYGYYVIETDAQIPFTGNYGPSMGREMGQQTSMMQNTIYPSITNSVFAPDLNAFSTENVADAKVKLISKVFLDVISKKLNKTFIKKNDKFADFIYRLVKQDYFIKKNVKITFFNPDEIVAFKVPSIYRKIVLFAKLYLATLTNNLLINLGRSHDKRIFYVETGLDADYQQAVNQVIQDVKTKEFKLDSVSEINTILNLNPGRFDDYFMPVMNGNRPVEIDTLQGMNAEMNNEFLEYLKNSILSGMDIPASIIDATKEIDYARTLSATNSNFVRAVIRYQKKFTAPFQKLMRKIFFNEVRFNSDSENINLLSGEFDVNKITLSFPSPATLMMNNLTEQTSVADTNANFIVDTLVPDGSVNNSTEIRNSLKRKIIKDLIPSINWDKYEEMLNDSKSEVIYEKIGLSDGDNNADNDDGYGGY